MSKMSGLGLSVLTVFSVASLSSSNVIGGSITSNIINPYYYESVSIINDGKGELCLSSDLNEQVVGDILKDKVDAFDNYLPRREKRTVQMQITKITKHVSKFDFEEVYEEI